MKFEIQSAHFNIDLNPFTPTNHFSSIQNNKGKSPLKLLSVERVKSDEIISLQILFILELRLYVFFKHKWILYLFTWHVDLCIELKQNMRNTAIPNLIAQYFTILLKGQFFYQVWNNAMAANRFLLWLQINCTYTCKVQEINFSTTWEMYNMGDV